LESDQKGEFLDELEGEFGITMRERELENLSHIQELLDLVEARMENEHS
jgi:acyl carrier protein